MTFSYHSLTLPSTTITGRYLAHNNLDLIRRAFTAADLHTGTKRLIAPTMTQSAFLAGVNRTYAHWANKRMAERAEIESGAIPLIPARPAHHVNGHALATVNGLDDVELVKIAARVGPDRMIAAAIAAEAA